jgi:hypothetical protein
MFFVNYVFCIYMVCVDYDQYIAKAVGLSNRLNNTKQDTLKIYPEEEALWKE